MYLLSEFTCPDTKIDKFQKLHLLSMKHHINLNDDFLKMQFYATNMGAPEILSQHA